MSLSISRVGLTTLQLRAVTTSAGAARSVHSASVLRVSSCACRSRGGCGCALLGRGSRCAAVPVRAATSMRTARAFGTANKALPPPMPGTEPTVSPATSYEQLVANYRGDVPEKFNIGVAICDRHVANGNGGNVAIIANGSGKDATYYAFEDLKRLSDMFANALTSGLGVGKGDVVAIYLPQSPETAIAHISTYKFGGIALPLFTLFGPEAVQFRLNNSGAKVVVTDPQGLEVLLSIQSHLPSLKAVVVVRPESHSALPKNVHDFYELVNNAQVEFEPVQTSSQDPAVIIYTSGTTGTPKGVLHKHQVLLGHLPGVEMSHDFFPRVNDVFWTPADWAWIGGLLDVLLPSLYHGVPVVAHRAKKFDPDEAFGLMAKFNIQNVFMPPTALKLIRRVSTKKFKLRSLAIGGETLGEELLEWGRQTFGTTINEFYGQTECNLILSNSHTVFPVRPGSMGRAVPGKTVSVLNEKGEQVAPGEIGNISVKRPDLTMFKHYLGLPQATGDKFIGDWMLTGDQARMDSDGYFWFVGRDDDIITSAGYRIGPGEVEDCLLQHPRVALSAVIGKPDSLRTEIVKAFVVLREDCEKLTPHESKALALEIQEFVKKRLAQHEYPREVEFVREIPMTTTGKIIRKDLKKLEVERAKTLQQQQQQTDGAHP